MLRGIVILPNPTLLLLHLLNARDHDIAHDTIQGRLVGNGVADDVDLDRLDFGGLHSQSSI